MSVRIKAFCSHINREHHRASMCSSCPDPHFWDLAFRDMVGFIMCVKELRKGA